MLLKRNKNTLTSVCGLGLEKVMLSDVALHPRAKPENGIIIESCVQGAMVDKAAEAY